MNFNQSLWAAYQPGYVHPDFVPYMRYPVQDDQGNVVMLNTWKQQGPSCQSVNPGLVRKNWGMRFALKFPNDPCPSGFVKGDDQYCYTRELDYEPVFYTKKAFVAKNQYLDGYTEPNRAPRRVSQPTDMRSVNPLTGKYEIFYQPCPSSVDGKYGLAPTSDSYL